MQTSIGKDHFGWVDSAYGRGAGGSTVGVDASGTSDLLFPPDKGHGIPHGYGQTSLYDGIVAENDDYHQWFEREVRTELILRHFVCVHA
jgi:hypothetical protein|tara:strand:- start:476 stop:742 length:267 start_codon:yes stop_codon:yes gene_type:complete